MTIPFYPFPLWGSFPPKSLRFFFQPKHGGSLSQDQENEQMQVVIQKQGHLLMGNTLLFYWLVDKTNGIIHEAKFQYFGHPYLLVLAEAVCSLVIGKTFAAAYKITIDDLDQEIRGRAPSAIFLEDLSPLYHLVMDVLDMAVEQCIDIPVDDGPFPFKDALLHLHDGQPYSKEAWENLSYDEQLAALNTMMKEKIVPLVTMDEGDVRIVHFEGLAVTISYSGNCSSCLSAVGSTLNSIGQLFRAHVYPLLEIKVDEQSLLF
ncbi:iron-sulfur cluster assembly scaffold protein [Chlamydia sp.]|uniref:iron-sulfur cluster assembly scaffold protein n=1 Tax=Chlamydia sp. TaxID=35827 RepID=UPI0025BE8792|nr:iron-sulfur cluster assembly scaffold protein [Chlamydia sp.]MBQ8498785.1 iron-sulfur cluster assembly scaffold protein [Chlamydia sp.]